MAVDLQRRFVGPLANYDQPMVGYRIVQLVDVGWQLYRDDVLVDFDGDAELPDLDVIIKVGRERHLLRRPCPGAVVEANGTGRRRAGVQSRARVESPVGQ